MPVINITSFLLTFLPLCGLLVVVDVFTILSTTVGSKEVKKKVKQYHASGEIGLRGEFLKIEIKEVLSEDPLGCMPNGDDTTTWELIKGIKFGIYYNNDPAFKVAGK